MLSGRARISKSDLSAFCRRNAIRRLAFFGPVLRDDFGPGSDIDVLVEFQPGRTPGLALIRSQDELSSLLGGHPVDLVIAGFLNPRIRDHILAEAEVPYDAEG